MDENKHFIPDSAPTKPPKRLFWVVIERLKLEKKLKIFKEKFSIFLAILIISVVLVAAAIFIFNSELAGSESGPLFSLLFSDTIIVLSYYKYFVLAILESMPVLSIIISLTALVLVMISLRFVIGYYDEISTVNKLIKNKVKIWN
jgi:ABC-type multidrug transport system permease subunit